MEYQKKLPPVIARAPYFIHGGDYNPEQWMKWKNTIWKEDMRLAQLAGMNSLSIGIFSWAALEPGEGVFHFEWLDEVMDNLQKAGLIAVLATPSGARPAWLSQNYPEVLRVEANRVRNLHGGRHNHCLTSPVYREKVREINTRLARRYKDHAALGLWHISNEYSGDCHCPLCQDAFRKYLQEKYKTLDALNEAWWTAFWSHTYTDWSQIESPSPHGEMNTHGLNLDWLRFTTEQTTRFFLQEIAPLREFTPSVPVTTNLMADYTGLDYVQLAREMDVVSWDNYPRWTGKAETDLAIAANAAFSHDLMYGLKRKPFFLMESSPSATNWRSVAKLHRPGVHILQSIQAVAHGSDSVQYFQMRKGRGAGEKFHGAVIDHEGTENTRVFAEVAALGKILSDHSDIVGTTKPAQVALIHDYQNGWAISDLKGALQSATGYVKTVKEHYAAFWKMGASVIVQDETACLDGFKLVVAPMAYMLREGFGQRVRDYVHNGGVFVATYMTGYVNDTDLCFTGGFPGPLKEVLGIWEEELDALYPEDENAILWNNTSYPVHELCGLIHTRGAETLGVYADDFYSGRPALTKNHYGAGQAYYIAARTLSGETDFLPDFYRSLAEELDIRHYAPTPGVSIQSRVSDGKRYIFTLNFTPEEKNVIVENNEITLKPHGFAINNFEKL